MRLLKSVLLGTAALVALQSAPAFANDGRADDDEIRQQLKAALDRVDALERRLFALEQGKGVVGVVQLSDEAQAEMRGMGTGPVQASSGSQIARAERSTRQSTPAAARPAHGEAGAQAGAEEDRKAPAPTDAVETLARSEQGHYGSNFSFESGFNYSRFSGASLQISGFLALDSIALGEISIDEVNADVFTTDFTARFGLTRRLQVDVNAPFLYRRTNYQSGGAGADAQALTEADRTGQNWGDISFGLAWRVMPESFRRPDIVINVRGKAPTGMHPFGIKLEEIEGSEGNLKIPTRLSTGTGAWAISGGLSVLKTIDPLVVYASANYFHNFPAHFDDLTEVPVQPGAVVSGSAQFGDAIQLGAGIAFALNDKSSLSTSFTHRMVSRSRLKTDGLDWRTVTGSQANVGVLNLGATFSLTDNLAILTNVGIGMTQDAPDMNFSIRLPLRF